MRTLFPAIVLTLLGAQVQAADPPASGQPDAEAAQAGRVLPPKPWGSDADPGTHPWNPDVLHADVWPYEKPLQVPTDFCGPPGSFWLTAEFLYWGLKGQHLPPLVTTGPTGSGAVPGTAGVQTVLGGNTINPGPYYGGRFTAGVWIDNNYTWAFEGDYFFASDRSVKAEVASAGQPGSSDIARPYFNVLTGTIASSVLASANSSSGYLILNAPTEFQGADANFVWNLRRTHTYSIDLLTGFRYQDLGGDVTIATSSTALSGSTAGTLTAQFDQLAARNRYFGGQVGVRGTYRCHQLVLGITKTIGLGGNAEDINIVGFTSVTPAGGTPTPTGAGLLTGPGNIGYHTHATLSMVDELDLKVGWQICDYVQVFTGYTLILQTGVVRPTDLIDVAVNPTPAAGGPVRPAFVTRNSSFWAQALTVGLEIRY